MIQGTGMQEIFDAVQTYSAYHYHIVEHRRKEQVILCSCASGIGTAEKLKTILTDSLPHNFPIQVLTYDYNTLLEKQMHDAFFDTYEVICIVGTLNPNIEGIRFIPIEDLIINDTMDALNIYFRDYMRDGGDEDLPAKHTEEFFFVKYYEQSDDSQSKQASGACCGCD